MRLMIAGRADFVDLLVFSANLVQRYSVGDLLRVSCFQSQAVVTCVIVALMYDRRSCRNSLILEYYCMKAGVVSRQ